MSRATRDRSDEWRRLVSSLRTHVRAGDRAVHKPLLTLLVIAAAERGDPNSFRFADVEGPLAQLLREFGRPTKSVHPEYPFWHLGSDGYWKVANGEALPLRKAGSHPTPGTLRAHDATAHVPESLWTTLVQRPDVRDELAATLLDSFWPGTLHADIRAAVGLPEGVRTDTRRRPRDPAFREHVLRAYERRCAVCGWDGRLAREDLALDAAHVHWHAEGGADIVANGLAPCTLHHVLLDRGALGVTEDRRLEVSANLVGGDGVRDWALSFHHRPLRRPQGGSELLAPASIAWHDRHVFRPPERPTAVR